MRWWQWCWCLEIAFVCKINVCSKYLQYILYSRPRKNTGLIMILFVSDQAIIFKNDQTIFNSNENDIQKSHVWIPPISQWHDLQMNVELWLLKERILLDPKLFYTMKSWSWVIILNCRLHLKNISPSRYGYREKRKELTILTKTD